MFPSFLLLTLVSVFAESLPQWEDEDYARLLRGEIIAGIDILVEDQEIMASLKLSLSGEVLPVLPEDKDLRYDPQVVPDDVLQRYFKTSENHLVDPQQLLSTQEYLDQQGFLNYHAENASLKIEMYLFDAEQNLPSSHAIDSICEKLYADHSLTAVVFCFMGNPDRNQLVLTGIESASVTRSDQRRILEEAKIKAAAKSDPVMQLESFVNQLSISLYWLEKDLEKVMAGIAAEQSRALAEKAWQSNQRVGRVDVVDADSHLTLSKVLHWLVLGLLGLLFIAAAGVYLWIKWRKSQRYLFPVIEVPKRLGANYAAGVGAVLIFHKKLGSPSKQRNQMPDYLRRM
ncbi:MAG: hypothetical protein ACPIA7_04810 [Akkermansiaceae bacterium]